MKLPFTATVSAGKVLGRTADRTCRAIRGNKGDLNSDGLQPSSFLFLVVRPGALVASLLLVVMPGAPSSFLLLVMPRAPSSVRVPSNDALCC